MPKIYSWIALPPETVVKGKTLPSHPLLPGLGSGTGLVWCHFMSFSARRDLLEGWLGYPDRKPDPKSPPSQKKTPLAAAERDATRLAGGDSGSGGWLVPDPISCHSPAAAPEPKANPCRQRGGRGPRRAPFPDGHGPSVPSVLDIPAEPIPRVLPATRHRATAWLWGHSCCRCRGQPVLGDTATPHLAELSR